MSETPKKIEADRSAFSRIGDHNVLLPWTYRHKTHTLTDVSQLNYFEHIINFGVHSGDMLEIVLGENPAEALYIVAVFDNVDPGRGPINIALVRRDRATPCRHGGAIDVAA